MENIPEPKNWISTIGQTRTGGPDDISRLIPAGGLDFFGENVVPGVISILLFAAMVGALIMIIVGGVMWITSGGDKESLAKAKGTVTYAIVGLVLALSSFVILNIIGMLLGLEF